LNQDITWTTNLGNAFLAQQQDVMDALQRMRFKAQQAGKLSSTSQQKSDDNGRFRAAHVDIERANPRPSPKRRCLERPSGYCQYTGIRPDAVTAAIETTEKTGAGH
jgi:hypothetical protein